MTQRNDRHTEFDVDPMFLERWSPRAFDGQPMAHEALLTILEAASWAPSASSSQPWRFVYAQRDSVEFDRMLGLLIEFNQEWAKNASALVFVFSTRFSRRENAEPKALRNHSFDCGTAWGYLALQAFRMGFFAHGMTGVHFDQVHTALGASQEEMNFEVAIAIGRQGPIEMLPASLREREHPNSRRPISDLAFQGSL